MDKITKREIVSIIKLVEKYKKTLYPTFMFHLEPDDYDRVIEMKIPQLFETDDDATGKSLRTDKEFCSLIIFRRGIVI
jgi:hypothetical protein